MSLEYLRQEWKIYRFDLEHTSDEEKRARLLRLLKSVYDLALTMYGEDLAIE